MSKYGEPFRFERGGGHAPASMHINPALLCERCLKRIDANRGTPGPKPLDIDLVNLKRLLKAGYGLDDIAAELGISWRSAQRYAAKARGGPGKRGRKPKAL